MKTIYTILALYLVIINTVAFLVFAVDKHNAKKKLYRVSEKNLMLLALFGGSIGALFAMLLFRHKTKHLFFTLGVPLVLFLQVSLIILAVFR